MPNANLDAAFVRNAVCPAGKTKETYYDESITGFCLECRATGGKTYALRYRDQYGTQRQHKIGDAKSVSFDKARSAAEKLRSRVVLGENPAEEKQVKRTILTVAALYQDLYLPHLQKTRRNMGSDLSFWKNHLMPRFGNKRLDEIKPADVVNAQTEMRDAGYAPGTANKYIVQLRYMYNVAKRAKVPGSEFNPAAEVQQYRVEGRERFLSAEEIERLRLAVARSENTQLKYIIALLLMLGCRKRELLDAKWDQFDVERRTWRIPLSKSGLSRHVPLSLGAIAVLDTLRRWNGCPYVVPNPYTFKPFTGINESWKTALRRAGIKGCRLHDLRHTFASNLVNAGHSLFVVSKALGHANIQQTSRYSHLSDDTLLAAADAAANAMGTNWTAAKQSPAQS
jgi:integrase